MTFRKLVGKIHLWLGLTSGLIVFIVAFTGCLYVFKSEIQNATESYRYVESDDALNLKPTEFARIARKALPEREEALHSINIKQEGEAVEAIFYAEEDRFYQAVYIHPNTGVVIKRVDLTNNFFDFVLQGHYYLWLPPWIGQPIVASATLIFVLLLISGMILWWPKNKNARKQRFRIQWKKTTRWKRKNYDLHNVLGFYVATVALVLALTGLVWGFQFFGRFVYWIAGGDKTEIYSEPLSIERSNAEEPSVNPVDAVYAQLNSEYSEQYAIEMHLPHDSTSSIYAMIRPDDDTYYASDYRFFDQYTLQELPTDQIYANYQEATAADKLIRMNYDIHTGAIGGLTGKIIAFIASLLCASLPLTGFFIWWGRRRKAKRA